jgi:hypothetical protein
MKQPNMESILVNDTLQLLPTFRSKLLNPKRRAFSIPHGVTIKKTAVITSRDVEILNIIYYHRYLLVYEKASPSDHRKSPS